MGIDSFDVEAGPAVAAAALPVSIVSSAGVAYRSDSISSARLPVAVEVGGFKEFRPVIATPIDD